MEKNQEIEVNDNSSSDISSNQNNPEGEQTPKLFSEEEYFEETSTKSYDEENKSDELFENDNSEEEDFEIPAFLRRQKFNEQTFSNENQLSSLKFLFSSDVE